MKFVQNVTTKPLQIRAEIVTTNGIVPITYRVSPSGIYPLDNGVRYLNLESLVQFKSLKVLDEEVVQSTEPDSQESVESELVKTSDEGTETPEDTQKVETTESEDSKESEEDNHETPDEGDSEQSVTNSEDPGTFKCPHCGTEYATQRGLTRHINGKHSSQE